MWNHCSNPLSLVIIQSRGAVEYCKYTNTVQNASGGERRPVGSSNPAQNTMEMPFKRAINGSILEFEHRPKWRPSVHIHSPPEGGLWLVKIGGIYSVLSFAGYNFPPQLGLGNVCTIYYCTLLPTTVLCIVHASSEI